MLKNVLCDRDGTIIYDKHYLCDPAGVELLPNAATGLKKLANAGADLFVVTNQSGIGRGMYTQAQYKACEARLDELLLSYSVNLKYTAYCPHAPQDKTCLCRKPEPGMWLELQEKFLLTPNESVMIGDKLVDIEFGKNVKLARTVLVLTGKGVASAKEINIDLTHTDFTAKGYYCPKNNELPDCVATNMQCAADYLLNEVKEGRL